MKNKECFNLALNLIKNDKKTNKHTILSYVFSITILTFILFIGATCYGEISNKTNKYGVISSYGFSYNNDSNINDIEKSIVDSDIKESLCFETYSLDYTYEKNGMGFMAQCYYDYPTIKIDNISYDYKTQISDTFIKYDSNISLNDEEVFMNKEYNSHILKSGNLFTENDNEIILSSRFVNEIGLDYDYVIGKTISYSANIYINGNNKVNTIIFEDSTIVGVYDERIYTSPSRIGYEIAPSFWCNNKTNLSALNKISNNLLMEFKDFKTCYSYYNQVDYLVTSLNLKDEDNECYFSYSEILGIYVEYKPVYDFIAKVFVLFISVILFVTIINMFITTSYAYFKNRKYFAMCKAIGMKDKDIKMIFFYNSSIILILSSIISIFISGILSFLSCIILNSTILDIGSTDVLQIKVHFWYFIPVVVLTIVFSTLLSFLISYIAIYKDRKEPMVSLLSDN